MTNNHSRDHIIATVERLFGLSFRNSHLIVRALTHRSRSEGACSIEDYERLEFLGDAVLQLVISQALYECPNEYHQGLLSSFRADLVNGETLVELGDHLNLRDLILTGKGLAPIPDSLVADAFEALLGALFLDQGYVETRRVVMSLFEHVFRRTVSRGYPMRDPKTALQQISLNHWHRLPMYETVSSNDGSSHSFVIRVTVESGASAIGTGDSKRMAEKAAAAALLDMLTLQQTSCKEVHFRENSA